MNKVFWICIVLLLFLHGAFAVERPWDNYQEYKETLSNHQDINKVNAYAAAISKFINEKCPPSYCKHVLIVGDDYVIPMERKVPKQEPGEPYLDYLKRVQTQVIYSDDIYAQRTVRNISDYSSVFGNAASIIIIIDDAAPSAVVSAATDLKNELNANKPTELLTDNEIPCAPSSSHPLVGKTIIIVGTHNSLLTCHMFQTSDTFNMDANPWDISQNHSPAIILYTDDPQLIRDSARNLQNVDVIHSGELDTDGDGWNDSDEQLFDTNTLNKLDNPCDRLPSLKPIVQQFRDAAFWQNALGQFGTQAVSQSFGTQSLWSAPALVTGAGAGLVLGVTGGIESDVDFFVSGIPQMIGGIGMILLNPSQWQASSDYTLDSFFDPLGTQCQLAKAGSNTIDAANKNYWNVALPAIYEKAARTRPRVQVDWDADDKRAFDTGFVYTYHLGFILEQIVLVEKTATEAGKALKEAKFLKPAVQTAKAKVLEIIGKSGIEWSAEATKGLEQVLTTKGNNYFDTLKAAGKTDTQIEAGMKAVGKYNGAEKLLKNPNDIILLKEVDDVITQGKNIFGVNPEIKFVDELDETFGATDIAKNEIEIALKNQALSRGLDAGELKQYLLLHEQSHIGFARDIGDIKNLNYIGIQREDALWFEEFANDIYAHNRLGDLQTSFKSGMVHKLNEEVTSSAIQQELLKNDYGYLVIQKARARKFNISGLEARIDSEIAGKSQDFKTQFELATQEFLSEADNLNSNNFSQSVNSIVTRLDLVRHYG